MASTSLPSPSCTNNPSVVGSPTNALGSHPHALGSPTNALGSLPHVLGSPPARALASPPHALWTPPPNALSGSSSNLLLHSVVRCHRDGQQLGLVYWDRLNDLLDEASWRRLEDVSCSVRSVADQLLTDNNCLSISFDTLSELMTVFGLLVLDERRTNFLVVPELKTPKLNKYTARVPAPPMNSPTITPSGQQISSITEHPPSELVQQSMFSNMSESGSVIQSDMSTRTGLSTRDRLQEPQNTLVDRPTPHHQSLLDYQLDIDSEYFEEDSFGDDEGSVMDKRSRVISQLLLLYDLMQKLRHLRVYNGNSSSTSSSMDTEASFNTSSSGTRHRPVINIQCLRSLQSVYLDYIPVECLRGLQSHRARNLKFLTIRRAGVTKLYDIAVRCAADKQASEHSWQHLLEADFSYNPLRSLDSSLQLFSNLQALQLIHCQLTTANGLSHLSAPLRHIDLSYNSLSVLPAVHSNCHDSLLSLRLVGNFIIRLQGLHQYTNLQHLELQDNLLVMLGSLAPLGSLTELLTLRLAGNPLCLQKNSRSEIISRLHPKLARNKFSLDEERLSDGDLSQLSARNWIFGRSQALDISTWEEVNINSCAKTVVSRTASSVMSAEALLRAQQAAVYSDSALRVMPVIGGAEEGGPAYSGGGDTAANGNDCGTTASSFADVSLPVEDTQAEAGGYRSKLKNFGRNLKGKKRRSNKRTRLVEIAEPEGGDYQDEANITAGSPVVCSAVAPGTGATEAMLRSASSSNPNSAGGLRSGAECEAEQHGGAAWEQVIHSQTSAESSDGSSAQQQGNCEPVQGTENYVGNANQSLQNKKKGKLHKSASVPEPAWSESTVYDCFIFNKFLRPKFVAKDRHTKVLERLSGSVEIRGRTLIERIDMASAAVMQVNFTRIRLVELVSERPYRLRITFLDPCGETQRRVYLLARPQGKDLLKQFQCKMAKEYVCRKVSNAVTCGHCSSCYDGTLAFSYRGKANILCPDCGWTIDNKPTDLKHINNRNDFKHIPAHDIVQRIRSDSSLLKLGPDCILMEDPSIAAAPHSEIHASLKEILRQESGLADAQKKREQYKKALSVKSFPFGTFSTGYAAHKHDHVSRSFDFRGEYLASSNVDKQLVELIRKKLTGGDAKCSSTNSSRRSAKRSTLGRSNAINIVPDNAGVANTAESAPAKVHLPDIKEFRNKEEPSTCTNQEAGSVNQISQQSKNTTNYTTDETGLAISAKTADSDTCSRDEPVSSCTSTEPLAVVSRSSSALSSRTNSRNQNERSPDQASVKSSQSSSNSEATTTTSLRIHSSSSSFSRITDEEQNKQSSPTDSPPDGSSLVSSKSCSPVDIHKDYSDYPSPANYSKSSGDIAAKPSRIPTSTKATSHTTAGVDGQSPSGGNVKSMFQRLFRSKSTTVSSESLPQRQLTIR